MPQGKRLDGGPWQPSRKHGLYAVANRGAEALPEHLRDRELETAKNLGTRDGTLAELERTTAYTVLVAETGLSYLRGLIHDGVNPWGEQGPGKTMLGDLRGWVNSAQRLLTSLAKLRGDEKTDVLDYEKLVKATKEHADGP